MPSQTAARSVPPLCMFVNARRLTLDECQRVAGKTQSGAAHVVGVCGTCAKTKGPQRQHSAAVQVTESRRRDAASLAKAGVHARARGA